MFVDSGCLALARALPIGNNHVDHRSSNTANWGTGVRVLTVRALHAGARLSLLALPIGDNLVALPYVDNHSWMIRRTLR